MEFPDLYLACENVSADSQSTFLRSRGSEFALLVIAAGLGEVPRTSLHDTGPILAVLCFLAALVIRASGIGDKAEKRWYDARAASESIKSACWQFVARSKPYENADPGATSELRSLLSSVLKTLPDLDVPSSTSTNPIVTGEMSRIRALDLTGRSQEYLRGRVDDQIDWYARKAKSNKVMAFRWRWALIGVEAAAVILGGARVLGGFDVNWLGILAAASAGLAAWQQAKNYTYLSESYAVTSHELAMVKQSLIDVGSEEEWTETVHDAELAFSREHTLWLARRQIR